MPVNEELATYQGQFVSRSFTANSGTRTYKLYVPSTYVATSDQRMPLLVMLHGCTQSADDFAAGTRMNSLAERHGFFVVYPEQAVNANGSRCWNWFRPEDQARGTGEPALIAGITREVASMYRIDDQRIFVAGLSAGAAMAVILGVTYPELYAAVGAHSGLPYAAAHDVASAFGAMKGRGTSPPASASPNPRNASNSAPLIAFHGDRDQTVDIQNAAAIVDQTILAHQSQSRRNPVESNCGSANGREYRQTIYTDGDDRILAELWVLHGAGHVWSGGSRNGSFTEPLGPDASAEMIRFFFAPNIVRKDQGSANRSMDANPGQVPPAR